MLLIQSSSMSADSSRREIVLHDFCRESDTFLEDVLAGLEQRPRRIPSKYFYDERGSKLFDKITELEAYYPTRTELSIMAQQIPSIVSALGPRVLLVEYGSGNSEKTRTVLNHLSDPAGYVPIDISKEHLMDAAQRLADEYPTLEILPVCADYTQEFPLPQPSVAAHRTVVYFPGSTIGNMMPDGARRFLRHVRSVGEWLLIGVDMVKDPAVLERAYNDPEGVTAKFNLNMLRHANERLGADFDLSAYEHLAFFNAEESRIEMHLRTRERCQVYISGEAFEFDQGETICTEYSYKYTPESFSDLAASAGFDVAERWTDERQYFSVYLLRAR
jgi:dimethylhistidine N-methyltransferase